MTCTLLADGLIASTEIVRRLLIAAFGTVEVVLVEELPRKRIESDLLFISRLCNPRLAWLPEYFRERNRPYVYFLDDNFYELTADVDSQNAAHYSHPAVIEALDRFIVGAAAVWVMSRPLEHYLRKRVSAANVKYLPAPVAVAKFDQYRAAARDAAREERNEIVIGYPTSRRLNVAPLLVDIVNGCREKYGSRVRFEFVGWCPDGLAELDTVTLFPAIPHYEDYVKFSQSRRWDIGIAPVGDSAFENCKTSLKYREYGAARIAGVYSDVPLFGESVQHGVTGLLAGNDPQHWIDALTSLIERPELRDRIAQAAYVDVLQFHEENAVAHLVHDAVAPLVWHQS